MRDEGRSEKGKEKSCLVLCFVHFHSNTRGRLPSRSTQHQLETVAFGRLASVPPPIRSGPPDRAPHPQSRQRGTQQTAIGPNLRFLFFQTHEDQNKTKDNRAILSPSPHACLRGASPLSLPPSRRPTASTGRARRPNRERQTQRQKTKEKRGKGGPVTVHSFHPRESFVPLTTPPPRHNAPSGLRFALGNPPWAAL